MKIVENRLTLYPEKSEAKRQVKENDADGAEGGGEVDPTPAGVGEGLGVEIVLIFGNRLFKIVGLSYF